MSRITLLFVACAIAMTNLALGFEPAVKIDPSKFGDRPFAIAKLPNGIEVVYVHGKFTQESALEFASQCGLTLYSIGDEKDATAILKELNSRTTTTKIIKAAKSDGRLGVIIDLRVDDLTSPKQLTSVYEDRPVDSETLIKRRFFDAQQVESSGPGSIALIARSSTTKQWGLRTVRLATDPPSQTGVLLSSRPGKLKPKK